MSRREVGRRRKREGFVSYLSPDYVSMPGLVGVGEGREGRGKGGREPNKLGAYGFPPMSKKGCTCRRDLKEEKGRRGKKKGILLAYCALLMPSTRSGTLEGALDGEIEGEGRGLIFLLLFSMPWKREEMRKERGEKEGKKVLAPLLFVLFAS